MTRSGSNTSYNWEFYRQSGLRFNDTFLQLFCEKNSDGTKKLRLKGKELQQRFQERLLPADVIYITNFLKNHPEVVDLDISYNPIEDEGLEILCNVTFAHPNSLEHLNISSCDIGFKSLETFYFVAQNNFVKLKTLRLSGNLFGPMGGHRAALAIPYIPTLEYLDIGDTEQTADSIDSMFLQIYPSTLKVLNVSRAIPAHLLQQVNDTFLAESISELFRVNKTLVEFHGQKCGLDAHDIEILILGLKRNSSLKFLDLGYNNICCVGVEFLSDWIKTRPNLLGLNIAGNKVGNHGALALSFAMPFSKLRFLDIRENKITDYGMIAILTSIKKPYMLRFFEIWGNTFGHPTNKIIQRLMRAKVFMQENTDVKVYSVDGVLYAARYTIDKYKHRYYGVMDHGCAVELKIKRNRLETPDDKPRALVNFQHIDRYPPVEVPPKKTNK